MDLDDFRMILSRAKGDVWEVIEMAISVAAKDYGDELKVRRDKIVQLLYATSAPQLCSNCNDVDHKADDHMNLIDDCNININNIGSNRVVDDAGDFSKSPNLNDDEDGDLDPFGGLFDDEQTEIISIKEKLEDPDQDEEYVVELLQSLADMDITFQALQETDIGRHVNRFRKHPSNEVRKLVKQLVRKWKETVDEWVRLNEPEKASNLIDEGSPQQLQNVTKNKQNGHLQMEVLVQKSTIQYQNTSQSQFNLPRELPPDHSNLPLKLLLLRHLIDLQEMTPLIWLG